MSKEYSEISELSRIFIQLDVETARKRFKLGKDVRDRISGTISGIFEG